MLFVYFYEHWHVPVILLFFFAKSHVHRRISEVADKRNRSKPSTEPEGSPVRFESDDGKEDFDNSTVSFLGVFVLLTAGVCVVQVTNYSLEKLENQTRTKTTKE